MSVEAQDASQPPGHGRALASQSSVDCRGTGGRAPSWACCWPRRRSPRRCCPGRRSCRACSPGSSARSATAWARPSRGQSAGSATGSRRRRPSASPGGSWPSSGAVFAIVVLVAGWRWQVDLHELMGVRGAGRVRLGADRRGRAARLRRAGGAGPGPAPADRLGAAPHDRQAAAVARPDDRGHRWWCSSSSGCSAACSSAASSRCPTPPSASRTPRPMRVRSSRRPRERSGSPASLIAWDTLGRQGRNFVGRGPDPGRDRPVHRTAGDGAGPRVRRPAVRPDRPGAGGSGWSRTCAGPAALTARRWSS